MSITFEFEVEFESHVLIWGFTDHRELSRESLSLNKLDVCISPDYKGSRRFKCAPRHKSHARSSVMGSVENLLEANGMGWSLLKLLPLVNMLKTIQGLDSASSNS
jgi:hypothetical protein